MTLEDLFKSLLRFPLRRLLWPAVGLTVVLVAYAFWVWGQTHGGHLRYEIDQALTPALVGKVLLGIFLVVLVGGTTLIKRNRR